MNANQQMSPARRGQEAEDHDRFDPRAEQGCWLEYVSALALRTRLAGLAKFAIAF